MKIYFLFQSKAFWPSWQSFYQACQEDERIETKMIYYPTPKQGNGKDGQFIDAEDWLKANKIEYTHVKDIDFRKDKPNILIMQTPYDGWQREAQYRSEAFHKLGIKIVYISYGLEFTEHKQSIRLHFRLPITRYCWRIYTFCKDLIADYGKYCPIGNSHVRCVGHPKFDALYNARQIKMPDWLAEKVRGRKIICWHPHFPCFYSTKDGKKLLSTFSWQNDLKILNYIKKDKEHFYIFMAHHRFAGIFENEFGVSSEEMEKFKTALRDGENSTVWEGDYPEVLAWSDAFLGERSAVTMEMITTGKPICYLEQAPEVYNTFGKAVVEACDYANNFSHVKKFLEKFARGIDDKKELRQQVFDEYFKPYWDGKCGERIKEDLLRKSNKYDNWVYFHTRNINYFDDYCVRRISILGLPLFKTEHEWGTIRVKFLKFIPLLKIKDKEDVCKVKLFDVIPFLTIKKEGGIRVFLCGLPFMKIKIKRKEW